jgi:hypothetical protein
MILKKKQKHDVRKIKELTKPASWTTLVRGIVLGECLEEAEGLQTPRLRTDQHPHLLLSISM